MKDEELKSVVSGLDPEPFKCKCESVDFKKIDDYIICTECGREYFKPIKRKDVIQKVTNTLINYTDPFHNFYIVCDKCEKRIYDDFSTNISPRGITYLCRECQEEINEIIQSLEDAAIEVNK